MLRVILDIVLWDKKGDSTRVQGYYRSVSNNNYNWNRKIIITTEYIIPPRTKHVRKVKLGSQYSLFFISQIIILLCYFVCWSVSRSMYRELCRPESAEEWFLDTCLAATTDRQTHRNTTREIACS